MPHPLPKELLHELRREAQTLKATVQIGKEGLTEDTIRSIQEALNTRHLVKVRMIPNATADRAEIREKLSALKAITLVQNIGKTFTLYKPLKVGDGFARNKIVAKPKTRFKPAVRPRRERPLGAAPEAAEDAPARPAAAAKPKVHNPYRQVRSAAEQPSRPTRPGASRPASARPASARPTASRPASARPGSARPGSARPGGSAGTARPGSPRPDAPRTPGAKPFGSRPAAKQSAAGRPVESKWKQSAGRPTRSRPSRPKRG
jgi:putative YhbY family RNA-binding protein